MRRVFLAAILAACSFACSAHAQEYIDVSGPSGGGGIRFGYDSSACSSSKSGAVRYNSSNTSMQYCNGSVWRTLAAAGCGVASTILTPTVTSVTVPAGCAPTFKVWGGGGGGGGGDDAGTGDGGGGGYAAITLAASGSDVTYYIQAGGGGSGGSNNPSGTPTPGGTGTFAVGGTGGSSTHQGLGGGGGAASGVWTGSLGERPWSLPAAAVAVAAVPQAGTVPAPPAIPAAEQEQPVTPEPTPPIPIMLVVAAAAADIPQAAPADRQRPLLRQQGMAVTIMPPPAGQQAAELIPPPEGAPTRIM